MIAERRGNARLGVVAALGLIAAWGCSAAGPDGTEDAASRADALHVQATRKAVSFDLFGRANLIHGIAADENFVFVTEPLNGHVAVHDRWTGDELGSVPAPPDGWLLPFAMRVAREGRLVVLDAGGFPNPGTLTIPRVYDYRYHRDPRTHSFVATLERAVKFDSVPVGFTEDVEVLDDGAYVVSDSILGSLWLVQRDGTVAPGIVADTPGVTAVPSLAPCTFDGAVEVGGIPFGLTGNFAPGVGSMATNGRHLYFGDSCKGGIYRVPVSSLSDASRSPSARGDDVELASSGVPGQFEVMKGLAFNRHNHADDRLYVADALRLRLIRVDVATGQREIVAADPVLFNFPVATAFLPSGPGFETLLVSSDQEHRFAAINGKISQDMFQPPFLVTEVALAKPRER